MLVALQGPKWFFGVDSIFELVETTILFLVFLVCYKAYRVSNMKRYYYYSIAFALLTLGHLARTITNFAIHQNIIPLQEIGRFFTNGYGAHIALTLLALVILVSFAFKMREKKAFAMLLLLVLSMILLSSSYYVAFYVASFLLFAFFTWHLFKNAREKKAISPKIVALAFILITITQLLFLLSALLPTLYVGAHIVQIIGFLILFIALMKVLKK